MRSLLAGGAGSTAWRRQLHLGCGICTFGDVLTPTPDYVQLAEAYGGTGERVESPAALESAIARALAALAAGHSALLDVFLAGGKWQG